MNKLLSIAVAGLAATFIGGAASASVMTLTSQAGGGGQTCFGNTGGTFTGLDASGMPTGLGGGGDCVAINPHSLWKNGATANLFVDDSTPSALGDDHPVWISFANTGLGGSVDQPIGNFNINQPNMIVTQEFHLDSDGIASLRQWADDTVAVYIDGIGLVGANVPNFTQNICAGGSPGCQQGESSFGEIALDAGDHVFTWLVWQVGTGTNANSNPFGLLYVGQVTQSAANLPEPGAFALLGLGLVGLAANRRRRTA